MSCLHDRDLLLWSEEQSALLRNREFDRLDIDNILEELEAVGKSEQHALYSHLVVLMTHLLKIQYQPEMKSNSWVKSIINSRGAIKRILKRHPSYERFLPEELEDAYKIARKTASIETGLKLAVFPVNVAFDIDYLLLDED